jgi:hypothetical protein
VGVVLQLRCVNTGAQMTMTSTGSTKVATLLKISSVIHLGMSDRGFPSSIHRLTNHQTAQIELTGELVDHALFSGSDNLTLFLAGRSLLNLLDDLFS